ncbi:uncharacterized protein KNAG_0H03450 [Huiozyma naganishii CBS 8797]|uniref:Transcription factor TFIIIC triple barrel domain-containing protein n=1 Tax=Huiozyma naganishii (strain ATCC MYA-139 / BCRC 22969 / CBS 8797 / KCTC 17520 / NBRC 10181 / NCYC 3082 / Yp74L-3) TaxID=1071383 RepID=J7S8V3_HUIN7|nr:hypothetical protein KNAG_0H03450 [Kazachstania naganishii CBS 8797]CCK71759.1 hypothetical protein KNAG_0H03450 [Kazachstania naganishii CBS 8797]
MVLKTVYIARHGDVIKRETTPGRDGEEEVFPPTGVPGDFPLSATGVLQSRELGHYLLSLDTQPEAILSSPGYRTVQTATLVNDLLEVPLFVDTGLNTWAQDDGDEDDDGAAQPADVDTLNKLFKDSVKGDWESCVPAATSAETQEILFARCKLFLSKVAEQLDKQVPDAETVLLVTDAPVKVALGLNLLRYGRCIDYLDDEEQTTIRSGYCSLDKYELAVRYNEEEDEEDQIVVPLTDREWRMTMNGNTEFLKSGEVGNWSFDRDSVVPSADREGSPADPETETVYVSVDLNSGSYKNRLQIEKNAVMQYSGMDQERPLFRIGDKIYEGSWERLVGTEFAFPDEAQLHRRTGMERAETAAAVTGNGDSPDALPERHHSAEDGSSDSSGFSDDEVAVATPEKRAERLYRIKDRLVLHSLNAV